MNDIKNEALDWNDILNSDGKAFTLLPEGEYEFEVVGFERGSFPGNNNMCACNKAKLTLKIKTEQGDVTISDDLILHRKMEWRLSQFFRSIGLKKKGEKITMNWNAVTGAKGKARIKVESYKDKSGNDKKVNGIDRYLDYEGSETPVETQNGKVQSINDWLDNDDSEEDVPLPFF